MFYTDKKLQLPPSPHLYLSQKKQSRSRDECQYCFKKQKLQGDDDLRCLMHSLQKQQSVEDSFSSSTDPVGEVLQLLRESEDLLDQYWNNLHRYSQGSPQKVKQDLQPVVDTLHSIQHKLERFPLDSPRTPTKVQPKPIPPEQQKRQTRSQKFITSNFSQLFEDTTVNDQIKEWVIYFQKIMIHRQVREQILPFDDEVDMRIFKESMERRFVGVAKDYQLTEKRLAVALEKLLFYMEASGSNVGEKVLQADIAFMEGSQCTPKDRDRGQASLLLLQAMTIEDLLAKAEL